jgi:hypothetical protein
MFLPPETNKTIIKYSYVSVTIDCSICMEFLLT